MFLQQTRSFVGFDDDSTNLQTTALTLNRLCCGFNNASILHHHLFMQTRKANLVRKAARNGMIMMWDVMRLPASEPFFPSYSCFAFIVCSLDSSSTLCTTNQRNVISNNSADDRVYIDNHDDEDELNTCQVLHLRLFSTPLESCVLHTSVISHKLQHP